MTWLKTLSGFRIKTPNIEKETNYYFFLKMIKNYHK